ncbi:preprotein translocase subunit YajC [Clostridium sp. AL.422]|uniref:preprotein translocase subunit YajC n=1 Tax=Clostridium TaxID=1485 RepID=UPI00293DE00C|nr:MULTISPECIES: preprotein translocase subunit YajC [unclassified Clostridium]MDV4149603.1 preprotein translocase subunit YajC [Clostridium sp. AL.422]
MINWEVVIWTCITIAVLAGIVALILIFISAKNLKKRTSELKDLHVELKPGMKVMFCGGIHGKIISVGKETAEIEVSKNVVLTVSRYSIQNTL